MFGALKVLTSVANEAEAELVLGRLSQEGIPATFQRTIGSAEWGGSGARNVLVDESDLDRARVLLQANEGAFSEDELARLSEEAGRFTEEP
jgi:hypothetical protein